MPNWCQNIIRISGSSENMNRLQAEGLVDGKLSLEKILPTPPELLENDGWYNWRLDNWGTRWDLSEDQRIESPNLNELVFYCDSAWGPPDKALSELAVKFNVKVNIVYCELGMLIAGQIFFDGDEQYSREIKGFNMKTLKTFVTQHFGEDAWFEENEPSSQTE